MSKKRQASTELNHDNWDSEDPKEHEEMGSFKTASKEVLEQREIRTAKRRTKISGDETKNNVFSGFGGIGKMQNKSFDFLANLTNGNKNGNIISTKTESSVTSSLFTIKPQSSVSEGIFGTSSTPIKKGFGITSSQTSSLFGKSNAASSVFSSKPDSTVNDSPFTTQSFSSSGDTTNVEITKVTNISKIITTPQVTHSIFGAPNVFTPNKIVSSTTNSSPFKTQPISNGSTNESIPASSSVTDADKKNNGEKIEDKKIQYYAKLKGLNEAVSEWIKKHVDETPLCILTPIFKDYEKYLKEIQGEYESLDVENKNDKTEDKTDPKSAKETITSAKTTSVFATANNLLTTKSSLFKTDTTKPSLFAASVDDSSGQKPTGFTFGINNSSIKSLPVAVTTTPGFSFGVKPSVQSTAPTTTVPSNATTSAPTSITTNTSTSVNGATPFSFGINKPFSFGSNTTAQVNNTENKKEDKNGQESEDNPPKVEHTSIVEENSVFDKRCKIFVKKDANFADKGVGTLYIKKIEGSDKHQLLVRANTSLGNVLLNLRLSTAIPTQKMGKNNVMIVCIPTPDSKPPPTSVLIRVKTSEEADELLEVLNKHKA